MGTLRLEKSPETLAALLRARAGAQRVEVTPGEPRARVARADLDSVAAASVFPTLDHQSSPVLSREALRRSGRRDRLTGREGRGRQRG